MPHNALSNISLNSSLYSMNQIASQPFVNPTDNQSFTSQIKMATNSTQAFASARAYSGYSSYTSQQTIIANPVDPGFSVASKGTNEAQKPLSPQDLVNNRFILQSVNGTPFVAKNKEKLPELSFDDNLQMSGVMGNYFSGKATLSGDQLKTKGLAMTRMLSYNPQLNELDVQLDRMLNAGAQISFDGYELTLKNDRYTLTWILAAPQYLSD